MPRFDVSKDVHRPILRRIAEPSLHVEVADLSDVTHPVNDKLESGKGNGMGILIGNVLYVATWQCTGKLYGT